MAVAAMAASELGYPQLKPEQADVIEAFVKGRDVFAVLPTCLWQECYGCLPVVFDKLLGKLDGDRSIVVVVAIMKDQVTVSSRTN